MKLNEITGYPLTIVGLRAWPSPKKGEQHSGITQVTVKGPNSKVKLPNWKRGKKLFDTPIKR